jgi:hypothetical protein
MRLFNPILIPCSSASDFYQKFKKRMMLHAFLEAAKLVFLVAIAGFFLLEYLSPFAQTRLQIDFPGEMGRLFSLPNSARDSNVHEVLDLAHMIRMITDDQISDHKVLRYAGLICHASQKYGLRPTEIIALIMAESGFKEKSVNRKTGDYGLGQINWEHWGKPYGLEPQDLIDPSINIFLTCHVYKFFGQDFGKYHRGNGIKCQAYLLNVKSILSTLNAFGDSNKKNFS